MPDPKLGYILGIKRYYSYFTLKYVVEFYWLAIVS